MVLAALLLVACSTTPHRVAYKKPPINVTVGQGPNRAIATYAMQLLGTPYHFGGSSPSEGFDCSGLIQYSAKNALNLNLPRVAAKQAEFGQRLEPSALQAGDLVFFNTSGQPNSHSGIYLGDTFFIHAPSTGGVVRVDSLTNPYWQPRLIGARRIR
ncbi:MAG: C40 family peptidase [Formosimonas sp.]